MRGLFFAGVQLKRSRAVVSNVRKYVWVGSTEGANAQSHMTYYALPPNNVKIWTHRVPLLPNDIQSSEVSPPLISRAPTYQHASGRTKISRQNCRTRRYLWYQEHGHKCHGRLKAHSFTFPF
jgi:hypothetical protein